MLIEMTLNVNLINILRALILMSKENRTARLTLLIDPEKKSTFEELCKAEDVTPSQKVRQFIREYVEQKLGPDWREQRTQQSD